jgi:hypothetical protein
MSQKAFQRGDIVRHVADCNWWPHSSVNRICTIIKANPHGYPTYVITPIDGEDKGREYVCGHDEIEALK